jgi:hypothetical protein
MKRKKLDSIRGLQLRTVMTIVVVLGLMTIAPIVAQANSNPNPGVLPNNSKPFGLTYGEWSAKWFQWALSIPLPQNPLVDDTGANAANGQTGEVWFLGGKFCAAVIPANPTCTPVATADRIVNIPVGKALFFPILNGEADNLGSPPTTYNETELRAFAKANMDMAENMVAEVDGVPINGLDSVLTTPYRVKSPVFTYHIPDNNIYSLFGFNFPVQYVSGSVGDGVYLMLAPLPTGQHKIHFSGDFGGGAFALDIKYTINVVPR